MTDVSKSLQWRSEKGWALMSIDLEIPAPILSRCVKLKQVRKLLSDSCSSVTWEQCECKGKVIGRMHNQTLGTVWYTGHGKHSAVGSPLSGSINTQMDTNPDFWGDSEDLMRRCVKSSLQCLAYN